MKKFPHKLIEDGHHVVRKCSRQKQARDEHDNVIGVNPSFFRLRTEKNELYLSSCWLEYFEGNETEKIEEVTHYLKNKMGKWGNALLAKSNVGLIKECGTKRGHKITVKHKPKKDDLAYSGILGLPLDNSDIALLDALSNETATTLLKPIDRPEAVERKEC